MPTTLRQIADKLNLSTGLVSKVLNDRPGVWASEETRRRIRHAAREMDYRPHDAARALRSGKTNVVALVIQHSSSPHQRLDHGAAFEGLAEGLGESGYRLLTMVQPDQAHVMQCLSNLVHTRSCDAVVLWSPEALVEEQGDMLEQAGMPFVVNGRHEERRPHWYQVEFDHEGLMAQVVQHFSDLGRRRIAYIGFDTHGVFRYRLRDGFTRALEAVGLPLQDGFIAELPGDDLNAVERQMNQWMELPDADQPDAIAIGANNTAWQGVEVSLIRRGRCIGNKPGSIAVAGQTFMYMTLMFGEGCGYQDLETLHLSDMMVKTLLHHLLTGAKPEQGIIRLLPQLRPLPSLHLHERIRSC